MFGALNAGINMCSLTTTCLSCVISPLDIGFGMLYSLVGRCFYKYGDITIGWWIL